MKKASVLAAMLVALTAVFLFACAPDDVGVPCQGSAVIPTTEGIADIRSQAMDCRSRLCLSYNTKLQQEYMCTAVCGNDGDCPGSTATCEDGFSCVYVTKTTSLACCKMCVCNTYLSGDEGEGELSDYCGRNPNKDCPAL